MLSWECIILKMTVNAEKGKTLKMQCLKIKCKIFIIANISKIIINDIILNASIILIIKPKLYYYNVEKFFQIFQNDLY